MGRLNTVKTIPLPTTKWATPMLNTVLGEVSTVPQTPIVFLHSALLTITELLRPAKKNGAQTKRRRLKGSSVCLVRLQTISFVTLALQTTLFTKFRLARMKGYIIDTIRFSVE